MFRNFCIRKYICGVGNSSDESDSEEIPSRKTRDSRVTVAQTQPPHRISSENQISLLTTDNTQNTNIPINNTNTLVVAHPSSCATTLSSKEIEISELCKPSSDNLAVLDFINNWHLNKDASSLPPCSNSLVEDMLRLLILDYQVRTRYEKLEHVQDAVKFICSESTDLVDEMNTTWKNWYNAPCLQKNVDNLREDILKFHIRLEQIRNNGSAKIVEYVKDHEGRYYAASDPHAPTGKSIQQTEKVTYLQSLDYNYNHYRRLVKGKIEILEELSNKIQLWQDKMEGYYPQVRTAQLQAIWNYVSGWDICDLSNMKNMTIDDQDLAVIMDLKVIQTNPPSDLRPGVLGIKIAKILVQTNPILLECKKLLNASKDEEQKSQLSQKLDSIQIQVKDLQKNVLSWHLTQECSSEAKIEAEYRQCVNLADITYQNLNELRQEMKNLHA